MVSAMYRRMSLRHRAIMSPRAIKWVRNEMCSMKCRNAEYYVLPSPASFVLCVPLESKYCAAISGFILRDTQIHSPMLGRTTFSFSWLSNIRPSITARTLYLERDYSNLFHPSESLAILCCRDGWSERVWRLRKYIYSPVYTDVVLLVAEKVIRECSRAKFALAKRVLMLFAQNVKKPVATRVSRAYRAEIGRHFFNSQDALSWVDRATWPMGYFECPSNAQLHS